MNKVVHFEIPFDDKQRSKKFYGQVFGWEINEMPEIGYTSATTTPSDENGAPSLPGAINGALVGRSSDVPAPILTISVDFHRRIHYENRDRRRKSHEPKRRSTQHGLFCIR